MTNAEDLLKITYDNAKRISSNIFSVEVYGVRYMIDISKNIVLDKQIIIVEEYDAGDKIITIREEKADNIKQYKTVYMNDNMSIEMPGMVYRWKSDNSDRHDIKIFVSETYLMSMIRQFNIILIDIQTGRILLNRLAQKIYDDDLKENELLKFVDINTNCYVVEFKEDNENGRGVDIINYI